MSTKPSADPGALIGVISLGSIGVASRVKPDRDYLAWSKLTGDRCIALMIGPLIPTLIYFTLSIVAN